MIGCALVLGAHALALGGFDWVWRRPPPAAAVAPVAIRLLPALEQAPPAARDATVAAEESPPALPRPTPAPTPTQQPQPQPQPPSRRAPAARDSRPPTTALPAPATPLPSAEPAIGIAAVAGAASEPVDEEAVPTYRTLPPPAATVQYRFRRGLVGGSGELQWRPGADGYELDLAIRADDARTPLLVQASRGGFDAAGLAPLRFTDKRLRRPMSAANFQRDAGRISYSGPSTTYALLPGSQDRLSALLQLGAIVAAAPALRLPGARIALQVAGAHGEAAVWAFNRQEPGSEGPANHLAYRKEPRGPYDVALVVWLDPDNGYLPSQLIWRSAADSDAYELRPVPDGTLRP